MHRVVIVALNSFVSSDLVVPCELFRSVVLADGRPGYRVRVCGETPEIDAACFTMRFPYGLSELSRADTIILPGIFDIDMEIPERLVRALRAAAARGARIASICSGAFILAATGLLDGRRATTHWLASADLARRFPKIQVDPHVLYIDEGQVLTSAGVAAAFDLCLHIVRKDYGGAVAAKAARLSVMPLERDGGQSQFIVNAPPSADDESLARVLTWLEQRLAEPITLEDIARRAAMSVRTLSRRFREQTGTTPLQWLITARVRRAQLLLETTSHSVERIATEVGFSSVAMLREHFRRVAMTSPQAYRRAFHNGSKPTALAGTSVAALRTGTRATSAGRAVAATTAS